MIIVVAGPTGVGKTRLSVELAKRYNAEVINADSMQVYKELNIGTAKVTEKEKENIPHHLFDIKNVFEEYTIYHYQKDLRNKIEEITNRGKRIINWYLRCSRLKGRNYFPFNSPASFIFLDILLIQL